MVNRESIIEAIEDLKSAKGYLEKVRSDFQSNHDLLSFYEPSAKELVRQYEENLSELISQETGVNFNAESQAQEVDIWVRLEGEDFHDGKGPIGVIGSYLKNLNTASQHAVNLLQFKEDKENGRVNRVHEMPSFDLVQTGTGSLKLGLRLHSSQTMADSGQLQLFENDPWEQVKSVAKDNSNLVHAFQLLLKALDCAGDNNHLNSLSNELEDEKSVIKLLHYAKDLAPSGRSSITRISFEGAAVGLNGKVVQVDKQVRKSLAAYAKEFSHYEEYVTGSGIIRAQDIDNRKLIARPLKLGDIIVEDIECKFSPNIAIDEIPNYLNQFVILGGVLVKNSNDQPIRLEIDEISVDNNYDS